MMLAQPRVGRTQDDKLLGDMPAKGHKILGDLGDVPAKGHKILGDLGDGTVDVLDSRPTPSASSVPVLGDFSFLVFFGRSGSSPLRRSLLLCWLQTRIMRAWQEKGERHKSAGGGAYVKSSKEGQNAIRFSGLGF